MINWLIDWSIRNRIIVIALYVVIALAGYWALTRTPIDAIPDVSDNQVIVFPNPLQRGQSLQVLSGLQQGTYDALLFDMAGRKIATFKISDFFETISLQTIGQGIYLLVICDKGKVIHKKKLVIW